MASPLLVVDAPSMLYRAFYGLPKSIKGAGGRPVNALLGTANLVLREVELHSPRAVVLCFGAEAAKYRVALYSGYHADRPEMPELLVPQWEASHELFSRFGWLIVEHADLEADDLLGSLASVETAAGGTTLIMTGDRDMFQCANNSVTILYASTGTRGTDSIGPAEVRERYGIGPEQVPDFIALRGDPSDGIPGAKGIGEKTARDLLNEYGSLDELLDHALEQPTPRLRGALHDGRDELLAYREMATLQDAGVERPPDAPTDWAAASEAAAEHGMNKLAERLAEQA
jgi:5'-3' exonuclease